MRVLVCGDRNWTDCERVRIELLNLWNQHKEGLIVIEGEARGADTCAAIAARKEGFNLERYPAEWNKYGKAAGHIRNQQMLDEGTPNLVLAFHDNLEQSKGTKHMVGIARKAGIEVRVITHG